MKKLLIYAFIFTILAYCVLAADANIYEAGDFNKNPEQMVVLAERDLIRINWEGKEHQIHVRKIYYPEKQKVDLTAFIEGSEVPFYATITPKTTLQLDFDRNDIFDMKVSLFNLIEEDGKKFVALKLEKLQIDSSEVTTAGVVEKKSKNRFYSFIAQNKIYLFIGVILLGLIMWKRKFLFKA